eukprot:jgi/Astpho2/1598/fgenesh1_pg.00028_%23_10_t
MAAGLSGKDQADFKQKLQGLVAASQAPQAIQPKESLADKASACIFLLVSGHPQAFAALAQRHLALTDALLYADFFHLTHGQRAAHQQQHSISGGASSDSHVQPEVQPQVAPENFSMLQQELIAAHASARAGAFEETYGAYMNLAELFAHQGKLQQARFFYQKGLSVAQQHRWREGEAAASLNLGMICEQLGDLEMAEAFHERHLQLAGHAVGALAGEEQPLGGADAMQQGPRVQTASMEELAAHESLIQVWQGL